MNKNVSINQASLKKYVLISGERPDYNYTACLQATLDHYGFQYEEVEGQYNLTSEKSFKVKCLCEQDLTILTRLGYLYHQESILVVDGGTCKAELRFLDEESSTVKEIVQLGTWKNIKNSTKYNHSSFNIINEQVYVVE